MPHPAQVMQLHPVLLDKLNAALLPGESSRLTPREARLPPVPGKAHAVIGMRRAGKTSFLRQLLAERRANAPAHTSFYLGFDDDRLSEVDVEQLSLLLEEYFRRFPELRGREKVHLFLDEIQLVNEWERFVRRVLDTEQVELVVSGSSARMLSREIHTSLRGRAMATVIRPFGFREVLRHHGEEPSTEPARWAPPERSNIEKRFREFLMAGGFPETLGLPADLRIELLQGYVDTVLFRDVVERHAVTQVAALRWIVRQCLRNPAGAFSVHRLHLDLKAQGHGVAKEAVHELLDHLFDAFLLSAVPLATESERRKNSNPRKLYPVDTGLIGAFDVSGRAQLGHALETVVCGALDQRRAEIGYVKTEAGYEVDFLARFRGGGEELIQVCADPSGPETLHRELRALTEAGREYPNAAKRLLVLDHDQAARIVAPGVVVEPVYSWLLAPG